MKKTHLFLTLISIIFCTFTSKAQKIENTIYVSLGIAISNDSYNENSDRGLTAKIGYGLNFFFSEKISTMTGIALHCHSESLLNQNMDGGDFDDLVFLDFPVIFQGHFETTSNGKFMLGIGPVFSACVSNDEYYIDSDPNAPLNGLKKIKHFNFSIMPCIAYELNHCRIGFDVNIGLKNIKKTYNGLIGGSRHINNVCLTFGVKF